MPKGLQNVSTSSEDFGTRPLLWTRITSRWGLRRGMEGSSSISRYALQLSPCVMPSPVLRTRQEELHQRKSAFDLDVVSVAEKNDSLVPASCYKIEVALAGKRKNVRSKTLYAMEAIRNGPLSSS